MSRTYRQCIDPGDLPRFELTPEQHEVMARLAEGLAYDEIAAELDISVEAVKSRIKRVVCRLNARNVHHALSLLSRHGLLRPPGGRGRRGRDKGEGVP